MSEIYSSQFWTLFADLDVSLDPDGPDQLYDAAAKLLAAGDRVLDVGCRDASHLIELVRRHKITGVGLDPVPWHIERAQRAVAGAGLAEQISVHLGRMQNLALRDASMDIAWCRDVVEVLDELPTALAELHRVLKPGGHVIIYTNVLNGPIDTVENRMIHKPLGNVVSNLVQPDLEASFDAAHFQIAEAITIGTQWREFLEERDQLVSRDLLRLARLRRQQRKITDQYGSAAYEVAQASLQWGVHQLLGRFVPMMYVLTR